MNNVSLSGRLCADPEIRYANDQTPVAWMRIAVQDGKEAQFFNVSAFGHTAEFVEKYFHKGKPIEISGRLTVNKWQTKDGENRYETRVIADRCFFCPSTKDENQNGAQAPSQYQRAATPQVGQFAAVDDDDVPF